MVEHGRLLKSAFCKKNAGRRPAEGETSEFADAGAHQGANDERRPDGTNHPETNGTSFTFLTIMHAATKRVCFDATSYPRLVDFDGHGAPWRLPGTPEMPCCSLWLIIALMQITEVYGASDHSAAQGQNAQLASFVATRPSSAHCLTETK